MPPRDLFAEVAAVQSGGQGPRDLFAESGLVHDHSTDAFEGLGGFGALQGIEARPVVDPNAGHADQVTQRIAQRNYDLSTQHTIRDVERGTAAFDASKTAADKAKADQQAKDAQRLAGGGAAFAQIDDQQTVDDAAFAAAHPNADTLGQRIRKSLAQNWAGFEQQAAGAERYGLETAVSTAGKLIPGLDPISQALKPATDRAMQPIVSATQRVYDAAQADIAANDYKFGSKGDQYLQNMVDSLVQMVPTVATAYLTKGGSLEAEAAAEGAGPLQRFLQKFGGELKEQAPSLSVLGGQQGAQEYAQSRAAGRTVDQASGDALVFGLAEAIPEAMPLHAMMKPGGKLLPRLLKTAGMEGASEVLTQAVEDGYSAGVLKQDMTWGQALQNMVDAGIVGTGMGLALGGGGHAIHTARGGETGAAARDLMAEINGGEFTHPADHAATNLLDPNRDILPVPRQPVTPGIVEQASAAPAITPEDQASPLPTDLIEQGRRRIATVEAQGKANQILGQNQAPKVGTEVSLGGKRATIADAFTDDGGEAGVTLRFASGQQQKVYLADLADAGMTLEPAPAPRDVLGEIASAEQQSPAPAPTPKPTTANFDRMVAVTLHAESGGRDHNADGSVVTSPVGARGRMQVMPATAAKPGHGIKPSDGSLDDDARVGRELLGVLLKKYSDDPGKAWAAYNWGEGRVDQATKRFGDQWLDHAPAETQKYVRGNLAALGDTGAAAAPTPVTTDAAPAAPTADEINFLKDPLLPASGAEHSFLHETPAAQPEIALATPAPAEPAVMRGGDPFAAGEVQKEPVPPLVPSAAVEGKQLVLRDITPEQRTAIDAALPGKARLVPRSDGAFVAPVKHEDAVRAVLDEALSRGAPASTAADTAAATTATAPITQRIAPDHPDNASTIASATGEDGSPLLDASGADTGWRFQHRADGDTNLWQPTEAGISRHVVGQPAPERLNQIATELTAPRAPAEAAVSDAPEFDKSPERAIAALPDDQLASIAKNFGVRWDPAKRTAITERISSNPQADVRAAYVAATQANLSTEPKAFSQDSSAPSGDRISKPVTLKDGSTARIEFGPGYNRSGARDVSAYTPTGEYIGGAVLDEDGEGSWVASSLYVNDPFRRKGVATALYDFAEQQGLNLKPESRPGKLSRDGEAFWKARRAANAAAPAFNPEPHIDNLRAYIGKSRGSLNNIDAIAKHLGLPAEQAHAVMGAVASRPNAGFRMSPGKAAIVRKVQAGGGRTRTVTVRNAVPPRYIRDAKRTAPMSTMAFVRSLGGINDPRHDLRNVGGLRNHPGVLTNAGRPVDEIGRALWEDGRFPNKDPSDPDQRPTVDETIQFLADQSQGKRSTVPEQKAPSEEDARAQAADDLKAALKDSGGLLPSVISNTDREAIIDDMLASGDDAASAAYAHFERQFVDALAAGSHETGSADYDIPFDLGAPDEASTERDRQGSGAQAGEAGSRPESQPGDQGAGQATGADRGQDGGTAGQLDAFGSRAGDQRTALERQGEGRKQSDKAQKAPGSDGGLFDTGSHQNSDMFAAPATPIGQAKAALQQAMDALDAASTPEATSPHSALEARLPEGYRLSEGRGLAGRGHWGVKGPEGSLVAGLSPTQEEAISLALGAIDHNKAEAGREADYRRNVAALGERLLAGDTPSDADLKLVRLKPRAFFSYLSPAVQEVLGVSRAKVREAMGDALKKGYSESGAILWSGDAKKALMNAAAFVNTQKTASKNQELYSVADGKHRVTTPDFANETEHQASADAVRAELQKRGVDGKVALRTVELIYGDPRIAGRYHRGVIDVALQAAQSPTFTANHEVVHFVKETGRINKSEWTAMTRAALADPALMASVERRYPSLSRDGQIEEAIADLMAGHVAGTRPQKGLARTALDRVVEFLRALGEALRLNGFATSHGTLARFESGEIGRREGNDAQQAPRFARADTVGSPAFERWFGASKVVDRSGQPLVVYHGSPDARGIVGEEGRFTTIYERYGKEDPARSYFFTSDRGTASTYADDRRAFDYQNAEPAIVPVYLSLQNPKIIDLSGSKYDGPQSQEKMIAQAKAEGHDGVIVRNTIDTYDVSGKKKADIFIAFDPTQIKSVDNRGTFDPADPRIAYSIAQRSAPEAESEGSTTPPLTTMIENEGGGEGKGTGSDTFDKWRTALQDRMLPLLRTQQRVETVLGRELDEDENPYLAEELMTGKVGARLDRLSEDLVNPLFAAMKEEGVSVGELESYLYARHAPERNAQIAKINPEFSEGEGSGMTDVEAKAIMARIKKSGRLDAFEALGALYDKINAFSMQTRVESGLLSQEEADQWAATYSHYAPLRGLAEDQDTLNPERPRRGSGINVRGKESQRAFGRRSKAADILAHTIMQAQEAIVRAGNVEVGQRLLKLVQDFPDPNFCTVDPIRQVRYQDPKTGLVTKRSEPRIAKEDADFTVSVKVKGEEHRITFNRDNPEAVRVADAMRNLTGQQFNFAVAFLGKFTRFFSAINTRYAPPFIVTNAIRDAMTASVTLQQYNVPGLVTGTIRDYRHALVAPRKGDGEWSQWRREFELAGGKIFFNDIGDINTIRKKIERDVKAAASNPGLVRAKAKAFFDNVQTLNDHVENAIRLAAYKNAREAGLSKDKAASIARNVTVNFTRRGKYGPVINSAYAFFNASTQGSATLILAAMKSRKVRGALGGLMVAGFLLDMLNNMMGDDDDDGQSYWSKVPEFDKERNAILMLPGGKGHEIKLPLGLGLNAFFNTGRVISEVLSGRRSPLSGAGEALWGFADGFNPLNGGGSVLNYILPTIADPIGEIVVNRNFAGKPIQPDQSPYDPPVTPSSNFTPNVNPIAKALTDAMNKATGGDEVQPGKASVSPNVVEYLFGYFTGSAGRFYSDVASLPFRQDATINDVPFVNKVVGDKPAWYDKSVAYSRLDDIDQRMSYAKAYQKAGDAEGFQHFVGENGAELRYLQPLATWTRKEMSEIRKARGAITVAHDRGRLDDATFKADKDQLDAVEQTVVFAFNKRYLEIAAKPVGLKP